MLRRVTHEDICYCISHFYILNMVSIYNDLGIFGEKPYEPGLHNISQSEVSDIYLVESGGRQKQVHHG